LGASVRGPVTLEILDSRGTVVRRYSNTDKPDLSQEQLEKQLIPVYWVRRFRALPAAGGMHRWAWDLRYPAPESTKHEYPIAAVPQDTPRGPLGPPVTPGEYTVRLSAGGRSSTAPLTVRMDPRVKISSADLEQLFQTETRLALLMTESTRAIAEARSLHQQIEKLSSQANDSLAAAFKDLDKRAATVLSGSDERAAGEPTLTRVNGSVTALYAELDRADAKPTAAQAEAVAKIEKDFSGVGKQWDELKSQDLTALNRQLHSANRPEIHLASHGDTDEGEGQDID
jgi:hypothetical protein